MCLIVWVLVVGMFEGVIIVRTSLALVMLVFGVSGLVFEGTGLGVVFVFEVLDGLVWRVGGRVEDVF